MKQYLAIVLVLTGLCSTGQSRFERAEALYEDALSGYRQRSLPLAVKLVEESIYLNPTAKSCYLGGLIYEALGEHMKALTAYEATLEYEPEHQEAIFQKSLIYLKIGDPEAALSGFNFLINNHGNTATRGVYFQIDPTGRSQNQVLSMENLKAQLYHYRGQAYQRMMRHEEALADYNYALEIEKSSDYYISRALLRSKLGEDSLATDDLEKALRIEPNNQIAWYNLALVNPMMDLPDSLLQATSFSPILNLLGARALEEGDFLQARRYFNMYLRTNEYDALGYVNRGRVLLKCREYNKAREDFEKAREIDPSKAEALYLTGNSYFFEQQYQSALAYYNQYLAVDPTNAMVWYNGAMSYLELGDQNEACHFLVNADKYGMNTAKEMMGQHCQ